MENRTPVINERFPWKLLLGGLLISVLCVLFPAGLLVLPALWVYAMFRARAGLLPIFAACFAACAFVLYSSDVLLALSLVLIACCSTAVLYWMQKKRMSNMLTAGVLAGLSIFILYCVICLPGILSGTGAFSEMQAAADEFISGMRLSLAESQSQLPADVLALYDTYLDALSDTVAVAVVPAICLCGILLGLGNLLFFRLFARKQSFGLAPMRPFWLWALPRDLSVGLCILLVGAAILNFTGVEYAQSVSSTVNVVVGIPLTLQGLCCVDYLLWRKGGNVRRRRVLLYAGIGLFFYVMQMPLMLVGCADQVFRFRDRAEGKIPPSNPRSL